MVVRFLSASGNSVSTNLATSERKRSSSSRAAIVAPASGGLMAAKILYGHPYSQMVGCAATSDRRDDAPLQFVGRYLRGCALRSVEFTSDRPYDGTSWTIRYCSA